jgi:hypothetical protein
MFSGWEEVENLEDEEDEEEDDEAAAAAGWIASICAGILTTRDAQNERRLEHRLYLRRGELLPDPRIATPWQRLWESQQDRAFITTMGFNVATFRLLLEGPGRFGERWENTPIPRNDVNPGGQARMGRRSLDGAGALGLVLHYLGSAMLEVSLQQIFALTPSTLNRYLQFAEKALYETLRQLEEARISMPTSQAELEELTQLIKQRHPLLDGAFASIDGLSLCTQVSDDPEIENATYNGWKSNHCINNVFVFSPEGKYPPN